MDIVTTSGQVTAESGEVFTIEIQTPDISQARAKELFAHGVQVGDWHWKHQTWLVNEADVEEYLAAICFYYCLFLEGPRRNVTLERFDSMPGMIFIDAHYAA